MTQVAIQTNIYAALLEAKKKFTPIMKDKKGYNYKYADISDFLDAVNPALMEEGIVLTQPIIMTDAGQQLLLTQLTHVSDPTKTITLSSIPVGRWAKTAQEYGSEITYMRRYGLASALGVASEDDDAASISNKKKDYSNSPEEKNISKEENQRRAFNKKLEKDQVNNLKQLLKGRVDLQDRILKAYNLSLLADLPHDQYEAIVERVIQLTSEGAA